LLFSDLSARAALSSGEFSLPNIASGLAIVRPNVCE